VLSRGEDSDTYTVTSILDVNHHEEPWSHSADVVIDNSGKALNAEDYKGYKAVISYGAHVGDTDYYEASAPMYVKTQMFESSPGVLDCTLGLIGVPDLLAEDSASEAYLPEDDEGTTVKGLIQAILGATLDCFDHCTAYTVEFDSEDEIIDSFAPDDSFRISLGQSRAAALRWLLDRTKCVMRWEADEKFHVFTPTISGVTYDYAYSLDTGHTFFSKAYQNSLVTPNKIYVMSDPDTDDGFTGNATDDSFSILPFPKWYYHRLASNAEAEDIAEAILSKAQLHAQIGAASVPMNCGQEVFDYINITDSRQSKNRAGNIGSLTRHYQGFSQDREGGIFTTQFSFGGWLSVRKTLKDIEVYSDEGYNFQRLNVKDAYIENLLADNILLLTLDEIDDGSLFKRVNAVHIDSGGIVVDEHITYSTGYNPLHKGRNFYAQPTTPYALGDLWFDTNVVKRCTTALASGAYNAAHWTPVTMDEMGDGTVYQRVLATHITAGKILLSSDTQYSTEAYNIGGKIKTFYDTDVPTATNAGDLWVDTDGGNKLYRATAAGDTTVTAGQWELVQDSASAAALATSKMKVYTSEPTTPYVVGDLWFDGTNKFKRCITALASGAYNAAHWTELTMDEIEEGTTYGRLNKIDIDATAGHIKLTSEALFSGVWYSQSGVVIDADVGIELQGSNNILFYYDDWTTVVGHIDGIDNGLHILGGHDVYIQGGSTDGGIGIASGGQTAVPTANDIRIDSGADIFIDALEDIDIAAVDKIEVHGDRVEIEASTTCLASADDIEMEALDEVKIYAPNVDIALMADVFAEGIDPVDGSDKLGYIEDWYHIYCHDLTTDTDSYDDRDDLALIKQMKADKNNPKKLDADGIAFLKPTLEEGLADCIGRLDRRDERIANRNIDVQDKIENKIKELSKEKHIPKIKKELDKWKDRKVKNKARLANLGHDRAEKIQFFKKQFEERKQMLPVGNALGLAIGALRQAAYKIDELEDRIKALEAS